jgi:hypothetical protein
MRSSGTASQRRLPSGSRSRNGQAIGSTNANRPQNRSIPLYRTGTTVSAHLPVPEEALNRPEELIEHRSLPPWSESKNLGHIDEKRIHLI